MIDLTQVPYLISFYSNSNMGEIISNFRIWLMRGLNIQLYNLQLGTDWNILHCKLFSSDLSLFKKITILKYVYLFSFQEKIEISKERDLLNKKKYQLDMILPQLSYDEQLPYKILNKVSYLLILFHRFNIKPHIYYSCAILMQPAV